MKPGMASYCAINKSNVARVKNSDLLEKPCGWLAIWHVLGESVFCIAVCLGKCGWFVSLWFVVCRTLQSTECISPTDALYWLPSDVEDPPDNWRSWWSLGTCSGKCREAKGWLYTCQPKYWSVHLGIEPGYVFETSHATFPQTIVHFCHRTVNEGCK